MDDRLKQILIGVEHKSLEDAIAADLVSAVPIIGAVSDFMRVLDSETKPRKALQVLDLISSPVPLLDFVTPTNTIIYLDKKGRLPFKLSKIDSFTEKLKAGFLSRDLLQRRSD